LLVFLFNFSAFIEKRTQVLREILSWLWVLNDLRTTLECVFNQVEINRKGRLAFFVASQA
jgi:hypothetical protein